MLRVVFPASLAALQDPSGKAGSSASFGAPVTPHGDRDMLGQHVFALMCRVLKSLTVSFASTVNATYFMFRGYNSKQSHQSLICHPWHKKPLCQVLKWGKDMF